jgi:hypothetical protein
MAEKVEEISEKVVLTAQEEWNKKYGQIQVATFQSSNTKATIFRTKIFNTY